MQGRQKNTERLAAAYQDFLCWECGNPGHKASSCRVKKKRLKKHLKNLEKQKQEQDLKKKVAVHWKEREESAISLVNQLMQKIAEVVNTVVAHSDNFKMFRAKYNDEWARFQEEWSSFIQKEKKKEEQKKNSIQVHALKPDPPKGFEKKDPPKNFARKAPPSIQDDSGERRKLKNEVQQLKMQLEILNQEKLSIDADRETLERENKNLEKNLQIESRNVEILANHVEELESQSYLSAPVNKLRSRPAKHYFQQRYQ